MYNATVRALILAIFAAGASPTLASVLPTDTKENVQKWCSKSCTTLNERTRYELQDSKLKCDKECSPQQFESFCKYIKGESKSYPEKCATAASKLEHPAS